GSFGRITSLKDLPGDKTIIKLVKDAMKLNDEGVTVKRAPVSKDKREVVVPEVLVSALDANPKAAETFNNFPYSCKKEYVEWITEAKNATTREKQTRSTMQVSVH